MGASRYSFWNSVENAYMPDLEDGAPLSALKESGRLLEGSTPVQAVEVSGDEAASDPQTVIEPESPCTSDIDVETLLEVPKTPVETALEMVGMDSVPSQTEQQRAFPMGASAYRSWRRAVQELEVVQGNPDRSGMQMPRRSQKRDHLSKRE